MSSTYRHYDSTCGVLGKGATTARVTVPMQPFAACFRSVVPDIDGVMVKLQRSTESFWVLPHAGVWPAAVPSLSFDSDRSDVELDEEREEEEQVQ